MFGQLPDFSSSFDFLRKLWSNGGSMMPGLQAMTPPMDLEEIDKRIHDLKAVEGWLQLNTNMLRTSIQGLEVQRATLVALQTFGNALKPDAMQSAMENVARAANAPSAVPPRREYTAPPERGAERSAATPEAGARHSHDRQATPEPAAEDDARETPEQGRATVSPDAAMWWNLLQQQFSQIASNAAAASMAPFGGLSGFAGEKTAASPSDQSEPAADKPEEHGADEPPAAGKPAAKKAAVKRPAPPRKKPGGKPGTEGDAAK